MFIVQLTILYLNYMVFNQGFQTFDHKYLTKEEYTGGQCRAQVVATNRPTRNFGPRPWKGVKESPPKTVLFGYIWNNKKFLNTC